MNLHELDHHTIVHVLYKALLDRDPDLSGYEHYISALRANEKTIHQVALDLTNSVEFVEKQNPSYQRFVPPTGRPHPYESRNREAIVFIHLGKTGGATLQALLSECFPEPRICPERGNVLHLLPPIYLNNYDLFLGHFDYFSTSFIPRKFIRRVSIFRNPRQRLISWYRFCRSHPVTPEFAGNVNFELAKELGPEEFFEHPLIRCRADANNSYLLYFGAAVDHALGGLMDLPDEMNPLVIKADNLGNEHPLTSRDEVENALAVAMQRVLSLDGIGLTERFSESINLIFTALGLRTPTSISSRNVTDENPKVDGRFLPVSRVQITPRLSQALDGLTRYDRIIYNVAKREFERRLKNGSTTRSLCEV